MLSEVTKSFARLIVTFRVIFAYRLSLEFGCGWGYKRLPWIRANKTCHPVDSLTALSVRYLGEYKGPVEMPALCFTWTMGNGIVFRVSFRGGRPLSHGR